MKLFSYVFLLSGIVSAQTPQRTLSDLDWFTGHWVMRSGAVIIEEVWLTPAGELMTGMSRTFNGTRVREYEFMTIGIDSAGTAYIRALPSGQKGETFTAVRREKHSITFENRRSDFPQRIIYRRISDDSLAARIEGVMNGTERGFDFRYQKIKN
ncbi:MAG: hypothetical protein KBF97_05715 [Bacteroidetes bacterium]|nr:hypothetical protein [Bacteroidota bacterium]